MAQLRDALSGEVIWEGTPAGAVAMAQALGLKAGVVGAGEEIRFDLLYDDVGLAFDPEAVIEHERSKLLALRSVAENSEDPEEVEDAGHRAALLETDIEKPARQEAAMRLDLARRAREEAMKG